MIFLSPKELLYIEDALGHCKFLITQCQDAAMNLSDPQLRQQAQDMLKKNQSIYNSFINLV